MLFFAIKIKYQEGPALFNGVFISVCTGSQSQKKVSCSLRRGQGCTEGMVLLGLSHRHYSGVRAAAKVQEKLLGGFVLMWAPVTPSGTQGTLQCCCLGFAVRT